MKPNALFSYLNGGTIRATNNFFKLCMSVGTIALTSLYGMDHFSVKRANDRLFQRVMQYSSHEETGQQNWFRRSSTCMLEAQMAQFPLCSFLLVLEEELVSQNSLTNLSKDCVSTHTNHYNDDFLKQQQQQQQHYHSHSFASCHWLFAPRAQRRRGNFPGQSTVASHQASTSTTRAAAAIIFIIIIKQQRQCCSIRRRRCQYLRLGR